MSCMKIRKCMKNLSNSFHLFQDWIRLQPVNIPKEKLKRRNGFVCSEQKRESAVGI